MGAADLGFEQAIPARVALVTAPRNEAWPDDEVGPIIDAFRRHGMSAERAPWHLSPEWESYDLIVLRSGSWDIFIDDGGTRRQLYLEWLHTTAKLDTVVINSPSITQWVMDKRYLGQLERRGVPVVPTTYVEVGAEAVFPTTMFVVKPVIGAGAIGVGAYDTTQREPARRHIAALHDQGIVAMVQPYVETLHDPEFGERALVFFNGEFGYAVRKDAVVRVGEDPFAFRADDHPNPRPCTPHDGDLDVAQATLRNLPAGERPFVARIDVVTYGERSVLAEASIDDPLLFLELAPEGTADRYVEAAVVQWQSEKRGREGG